MAERHMQADMNARGLCSCPVWQGFQLWVPGKAMVVGLMQACGRGELCSWPQGSDAASIEGSGTLFLASGFDGLCLVVLGVMQGWVCGAHFGHVFSALMPVACSGCKQVLLSWLSGILVTF